MKYILITNPTWGNSNFDADLLLPSIAFLWFQFLDIFLVHEISLSEET